MDGPVGSNRVDMLGSADILLFEGFRLDRRGAVLYRLDQGASGVPVALGARTVALLGLLAGRQGAVVSKDEIMKAVWPGRVVEEANLNVQVSKLRQILDQNGRGQLHPDAPRTRLLLCCTSGSAGRRCTAGLANNPRNQLQPAATFVNRRPALRKSQPRSRRAIFCRRDHRGFDDQSVAVHQHVGDFA